MTAEVRARTLTGRNQISDGGQHLIDGVPFGRPYLRHPHRPSVRIPPRKRQQLDNVNDDEDSDDESDADEEWDRAAFMKMLLETGGDPSDLLGNTLLVEEGAHSRPGTKRSRKTVKRVQFEQPLETRSDDSEEDDEDFAPEGEGNKDVSADGDSDGSDSVSDSDASSSASDTSKQDSESESDSSEDSGSDSDSDASSPPDVLSSRDGSKQKMAPPTPSSPKHVPPGGGRSTTKSRNARRSRANRLRHLKETGALPEEADLNALQIFEDAKRGEQSEVEQLLPAHTFSVSSGKRKRLEEHGDEEDPADHTDELERRKQELMARFGDASSTTVVADEPTESQPSLVEPAGEVVSETPAEEQPAKKEPPFRRLRPDTSAISRILARQAARPVTKKAKTKPVVEGPPEPEGALEPDFWKSRINLSAFECWEEDYELSAPPFPFEQHWDPASKSMREKGKKSKKRGGRQEPPPEPVQSEDEEEKIILDYDDAPVTGNPDAEITAAIEDQLRQDVAVAAQADLPPLPEDLSTLQVLTSSDIKQGAVIVCKFFAVNPITITPEISDYKTAVVEREGDSGHGAGTIQLKIASRDLPKKEKKFDSKGNRIYDVGDAFMMEDEDEDEGLWEGQFTELLESKLLQAA